MKKWETLAIAAALVYCRVLLWPNGSPWESPAILMIGCFFLVMGSFSRSARLHTLITLALALLILSAIRSNWSNDLRAWPLVIFLAALMAAAPFGERSVGYRPVTAIAVAAVCILPEPINDSSMFNSRDYLPVNTLVIIIMLIAIVIIPPKSLLTGWRRFWPILEPCVLISVLWVVAYPSLKYGLAKAWMVTHLLPSVIFPATVAASICTLPTLIVRFVPSPASTDESEPKEGE
jgi:asparagine N-glycosylation enzyme membrane subunit Stt3